jgi:hypothetical protein
MADEQLSGAPEAAEVMARPRPPEGVRGDSTDAAAAKTDDVTEAAIKRGTSLAGNEADLRQGQGMGAAPQGEAETVRSRDLAVAEPGWPVLGSDGALLGPVGDIAENFLTVVAASPYGRDMYIPREYVEEVRAGKVILSKPRSLLLDMKLDETPIPVAAVQEHHETGAETSFVPPPLEGTPYSIDSASQDEADGPTRQPSVAPGYQPVRGQPTTYAPYITDLERNEDNLDLHKNRAPAPGQTGQTPRSDRPST